MDDYIRASKSMGAPLPEKDNRQQKKIEEHLEENPQENEGWDSNADFDL